MDIRVLGDFTVVGNGVAVAPGSPEGCQVLALLAAHADQVVPVEALAAELSVLTPPERTHPLVRDQTRRVRELLRSAGLPDSVLVELPGGYRLDTAAGTLDVRAFEREAGAGYRAMETGDLVAASLRLRAALDCWSGPRAFAGVVPGDRLGARVRLLDQARLRVLDQWVEAQLALGRHRELLAELGRLVEQYRTQESLHGQYMVALHRSGRQAEAHAAYRALGLALEQDLGRGPSSRLRLLHRSIRFSGVRTDRGLGGPAHDLLGALG